MKDIQYGRHVVTCDSCGETQESKINDTWAAFWPTLREKGWRAINVAPEGQAPEWEHYCCYECLP